MYDLLGGGFHRYSVDRPWLVPHFEKMLYDNALLAATYLHAWVVTGDERYRRVVEETLDYLLRELRLPGGRLRLRAGRRHRRRRGADLHVDARGGRARGAAAARSRTGARSSAASSTRSARRLFELREQRPKPARDDKAIAAWNGLALAALAEAGRRLERADYLDAARAARRVPARPALRRRGPAPPDLPRRPGEGHRLPRGLRRRRATACSSCTSRRASCAGSRRRTAWRASPSSSSPTSERGGFYLSPADGEELVARKKDLEDQPTPSGNSMLALVLLKLGADLRRRRARAA